MKLSYSLEKYIKTIYLLDQGKDLSVTSLAKTLNFSKAAVSKTLKKLSEIDFIEYEKYGEIKLLEVGCTYAKDIIDKENLLELFLVNVLEVEIDHAKSDVEIFSAHISNETKDALLSYIKKITVEKSGCKCKNESSCTKCHIKSTRNNIKQNPNWQAIVNESK